tara:strand:+ start:1413 stop:1676 length:264 start_codon:yes stop_codon:yes gene_type:complete
MPKGHRSAHGYATVNSEDGCLGYREIAEIMTKEGDKMNHSTARNVFLRAMNKIATPLVSSFGVEDSENISQDPRFQACIQEMINDMV